MRRGGGLYGNFVSASDDGNRPYRGAEIPPPPSLGSGGSKRSANQPIPGVSKHGYSTISAIASTAITHNSSANEEFKIKRARTEEEYFDDDDEDKGDEGNNDLPYQPAPGSPGPASKPERF